MNIKTDFSEGEGVGSRLHGQVKRDRLPRFNVGDTAIIKTEELVIVKKWRGLVKILEVQKDRRKGGTYQYLIEDIPPEGVFIKLQGIVNEEDLKAYDEKKSTH